MAKGKVDPSYHRRKNATKYKVGDRVVFRDVFEDTEVRTVVRAGKNSKGKHTYTLEDASGYKTVNWWHNDEIKLAPKVQAKPKAKITTSPALLSGTIVNPLLSSATLAQLEQLRQNTTSSPQYNPFGQLAGAAGQRLYPTLQLYSYQQGNPINPNQGNTMPAKFKVGDTVQILAAHFGWGGNGVQPGDVGKVIFTNNQSEGLVYHLNIEGKVADWSCLVQDIELASGTEETPKVKVEFESVIMAEGHRQQILDALGQIEDYELIFKTWGFESIMEKGKAISMLFYGPPGTGKTLCAQAIADHLGKKLKVISTADVESSSPGQAERNIKAHFAEGKNDVLLFDECDSLVYSRDAVGSILGAQINQLLTSLENFDGVVCFTTNRLGVLDEAFNRRLSLKLEFAMPTPAQRELIWKRMFPEACPLDKDINWKKLAELPITGGYIKNIVIKAARTAARQKLKAISYDVIVAASKSEVRSMQEFEEARRQHRQGVGIAGTDEFGQRMIRTIKKEMSNG